MRSTYLWGLLGGILGLALAGGVYLAVDGSGSKTAATTAIAEANLVTIEMTAFQYGFKPEVIKVRQGDRVRLRIDTKSMADSLQHGIYIPHYKIEVPLKNGGITEVEFIAHTPGEFTFECSQWCDFGHHDMHGTLIVEPNNNVHIVELREVPRWYFPDSLRVEPGDTVKFVGAMHSGTTHTMTAIDGPELFNSGPVGGTWEYTFTKPGVYTYLCEMHPYMVGRVAVGVDAPDPLPWPVSRPELQPPPAVKGVGEVWVNTQFEVVPGQKQSGTMTVVDATNWQIKKVISGFANPHNFWNSPDGSKIFQTNFHGKTVAVIDSKTMKVIDEVDTGESPGHVHTHPTNGKVYATANGEDFVAVLDGKTHDVIGKIKTPLGPHGIWISQDGKLMTVAATLSDKIVFIDPMKDEVIAIKDVGRLPLATSISADGKWAFITAALGGTLHVFDTATFTEVAKIPVGKVTIQVVADPTSQYVVVANTGTAEQTIVSTKTWEVAARVPGMPGAHGVTFGHKQGGGYYAYISNKYVPAITVIDMDTLKLAGHIELPPNSLGGNGILGLPNVLPAWNK